MALNLFIDTNIFLSFYHMTNEDLDELRKLTKLIKKKEIILFLTEQVKQESQRNRESKIADAMNHLRDQKFSFQFPNMCKGYPEYEKLRDGLKECSRYHMSLINCLEKDILREKLEADKIIEAVFGEACYIKTTKSILKHARIRKQLRNPPGKPDSMGDAINWEALLAKVPNGENIYVVSGDRDFQAPFKSKNDSKEDRIHPYLSSEWKSKKDSEIHFYTKLSGFFGDLYSDIQLSEDLDKEFDIRSLSNSPNFSSTHTAIEKLKRYGSNFSKAQIHGIIHAVLFNSQVHWIIEDWDVREFIDQLVQDKENEIDSEMLKDIRELLGSESSHRKAEDVCEEDDLPF